MPREAPTPFGIAIAPPAPPYLGLHAELSAHLAIHRFVAGDTSGACALAREAQVTIVPPAVLHRSLNIRVPLAVIIVLSSGSDPDVLHAELQALHDAARRYGWPAGSAETVALYGSFLAVAREDWGLAARLLAAGGSAAWGHPGKGHLAFHFADRIRAVLGPEIFRTQYEAGRAMPLGDAVAVALS